MIDRCVFWQKVLAVAILGVSSWRCSSGQCGVSETRYGIGLVPRSEKVTIYRWGEGQEVEGVVGKDFPLLSWNGTMDQKGWNSTLTETSTSGDRIRIRYWQDWEKSLEDADGKNTGWVDMNAVRLFHFSCEGEKTCSGVETSFSLRTMTEHAARLTPCFQRAWADAQAAAGSSAASEK